MSKQIKITPTDSNRCKTASAAIGKLMTLAQTDKYKSLQGLGEEAQDKLSRLALWYAAHAGTVVHAQMIPMPLTWQQVRDIRGACTVLWAYAYKCADEEKIKKLRADVLRATNRAESVLDWLGKK